MDHSNRLMNFIESLTDFNLQISKTHEHMAATIIDGILQAGIKYNSVVKPRIAHIKLNYPNLSVTSQFQKAIVNNELEIIAQWTNYIKLNRIKAVTNLFFQENIETESELGEWLNNKKNISNFKQLNGIADKTADYFQILAGNHAVAIDRHLIGFLNCAGIEISIKEYQRAHTIISNTAQLLNLNPEVLDYSIWAYMSSKKHLIKCY